MTLEELNLTCDRLEAAQACRNLVGKLSYFDSAFRTNDFIALWATRKTPRWSWTACR